MRENCQIRLFKFGSEANVFMIVATSDYKNHVLKHCKELSPVLIGKWNRLLWRCGLRPSLDFRHYKAMFCRGLFYSMQLSSAVYADFRTVLIDFVERTLSLISTCPDIYVSKQRFSDLQFDEKEIP